MNIDRKLTIVQEGKMAEIAYNAVVDEVRRKQSDLLKTTLTAYKVGNMQHDAVMGFISSYAILEDLLDGIRRKINTMSKLDKEAINDDPNNPPRN